VVLGPGQRPPTGTQRATWGVGRHAVFDFHGPYRAIAAGFDALFRRWPTRDGPRLRPGPYLELYRSLPGRVPERELLTELWIPVED
jgi:AraC family transcriptional regulator